VGMLCDFVVEGFELCDYFEFGELFGVIDIVCGVKVGGVWFYYLIG